MQNSNEVKMVVLILGYALFLLTLKKIQEIIFWPKIIYVHLQLLLSDVSFGKIDRRTNSIFTRNEISIYFGLDKSNPWQPFMLYWICDYKYLVFFRSDLVPVDLGDRGENAPIRFCWDKNQNLFYKNTLTTCPLWFSEIPPSLWRIGGQSLSQNCQIFLP